METFRAVAEELSFSRAAAKLGYVQSSVSAQVAALEQDLGVPLFDRLGRRIALTEAGVVMLSHSRRLLAFAEETRVAVADAGVGSGEVTGSLTVSAPETLLTYRLPRLLALFHERHPKVRLSVRPSAVGRLVGSARRVVEEGGVDVAFVLDEPSGDRPAPAGLETEDLVEEGVVVISPAAHALASSSRVVPADIAGETLLLPEAPESGCAYRGQFERHLGADGVVPPERMEFQSIEAIKRCVAAGMGVSVLPSVAVEGELAAGDLSALAWGGTFDVRTRMAWHGERWKSPALRAFLEAAREVFDSAAAPAPSAVTPGGCSAHDPSRNGYTDGIPKSLWGSGF
ncbi:MAG: LysR family transcriptional regulator [Actinomycetota bacterium]|nr:LysR family transcriptional regulator [Actinomycetota bacterium]